MMDRHPGRHRALRYRRLREQARGPASNALRPAVRPLRRRHARGPRRRLPGPPRPGPPSPARRGQLPGQHLRFQEAGRRADHLGQLRRLAPRGDPPRATSSCADQFFDRTRRPNTFFGGGIVAHVSLGQPVCPELAGVLYETAVGLGLRAHRGGTYICIDGPAFSTKAESLAYRAWGADIIGMTAATEAKLCREAEICYATLSLATDYDVWHETEEPVTVELVLQNLAANIANAKAVIKKALAALRAPGAPACDCGSSLRNTIVTAPSAIPAATRKKLGLLVDKYLPLRNAMSLAIVGSVAFDTIRTPWGDRERIVGGSGTYWLARGELLHPAPHRRRRRPGLPAEDPGRAPRPRRRSGRPQDQGRQDLPLGRPLCGGPQPPDDAADGAQRLRRLPAPDPGGLPGLAHRLPGQPQSGAPRLRPRPVPQAGRGRHGHDPPLDRHEAGGPPQGARPGRHLLRQRRGGPADHRGDEPHHGRQGPPRPGPVARPAQEGRARRARLRPRSRLRRPGPPVRARRRPDRARATASPADSWATSTRRGAWPSGMSAGRPFTAASWPRSPSRISGSAGS